MKICVAKFFEFDILANLFFSEFIEGDYCLVEDSPEFTVSLALKIQCCVVYSTSINVYAVTVNAIEKPDVEYDLLVVT